MTEKVIEGFPDYTITEDGVVTSYRRINSTIITGKYSRDYRIVGLRNAEGERKHLSVHRLVAKAFLPNPKNLPIINHIDGNARNNSISNLEWCTISENARHSIDIMGVWPTLKPLEITFDGVKYKFDKRMEGIAFIADLEGLSFDHVRKLMTGQRKDVKGVLDKYVIEEMGGRCNDYPERE